MLRRYLSLSSALVVLLATPVLAQQRSDFRWQGAVAAGGEVSISNINGDVKVVPSSTGRVDVVGYKRGDSEYFDRVRVDVQPTSRGLAICVVFEDFNSSCDDRGDRFDRGRGRSRSWDRLSMNLEIAVPTNLTVSATTVSGDVAVTGAQGDVRATSVSGDLQLSGLHASSVQANTVSGDIVVRVDQFTGRGDLQFNTVSGDVTLEVPKQFDADLSMSTVSGEIDSDFQMVVSGRRQSRRNIDARIGAGGRRLDLNTVSGDVRIRMIN